MAAKVKLFALACIDPRFRHATQRFVEEKYSVKPEEYDLKLDAGGCKEIADHTEAGRWIFQNMQIGVHHHGAGIIVLINHIDCAHYGGSKAFAGRNQEIEKHKHDLAVAAQLVRGAVVAIVEAYLVAKQGDQFVFQKVEV